MSVQAPASKPPTSVKYSIEQCAWCSGTGHKCTACDGNGLVLVRMPVLKCPRCVGTGMERNRSMPNSRICVICSGTGWAMVVRKPD
jgi:DnaJ-class molecular chaperone